MDFWDRVDVCLKEQDSSYRYLATMTGLRESTISMMRKRHTEPRIADAITIAKALCTTAEYLGTGERPQTLSLSEYSFFLKARKYRDLIEDLGYANPLIVNSLIQAIHVSANEARGIGGAENMGGLSPQAEIG